MDPTKKADQHSRSGDDEDHLCEGFAETLNLKQSDGDNSCKEERDEKEDKDETAKDKEEMIQRLETKLAAFDYPPNWILDQEDFHKHAQTVYMIMCDKMREMKRVDEEEGDSGEIKLNALDTLGKQMTQIFLGIHFKKFDRVDGYINDAEEFLSKCRRNGYFDDGYVPGILHCLNGLKALLMTQMPPSASSVLEIEAALAELHLDTDTLSTADPLAKVGLLALKFVFTGEVHQGSSYKEQTDMGRKMIELEPTSGQWYLWLYSILRFERRQGWSRRPGREEIAHVVKAATLDPGNALILGSLCDVLAETLKQHGPHWTGVEEFGPGRTFHSSLEILHYLEETTQEVIVLDPTSVKTNISVAQIFSTVVPKKFRDYPLAKSCIDRALHFHPVSSKANHRMAIFCLTVEKNVPEAIKYFENAVESDPRNFPAVADLLQLYLASPESNQDKIQELFDREFEDKSLSEAKVGVLHVTKGIQLFMQGNTSEALEEWHNSLQKKNFDINYFQKLQYFVNKNSWPSQDFSIPNVVAELKGACAAGSTTQDRKESFVKILGVIEGCSKENTSGSWRGRGGGGERHGHSGGRGRRSGGFRGNCGGRPFGRGSGERFWRKSD